MENDAKVRIGRVRAVYERIRVTLAVTAVSGIVVAAVMSPTGASGRVAGWLALLLGLAALRLLLWLAHRRDSARASLATWERLAVAGSLLSGLVWGVGAAVMVPGEAMLATGHLVWLFVLGAMCVGAATVHAVHLVNSLAFLLAAGLPLAARLAMEGDARDLGYATMILAFVVALAGAARRFVSEFDERLRLQLALDRRTEELDSANARLRAEIESHRATGDSLRQAQRLEAIGRLTGGVAHDFNNVLAVIAGNLQLIARRAQGNADVIRLAAAAERAAERGARLTASLLSFAREQRLRPEPVDLNALVREFAPLLRRTLGERMELVLDLSQGPAAALADAAHFQSALLNLAINARDASPPGGRLTIATRPSATAPVDEVALDDVGAAPPAGPFVAVTVCDTGPGMAPEVAARAFEPFFTTKEVGKGSGLGLSQVYGFARQSGGRAGIRSNPGGGTEVSIHLPAIAEGAVVGDADPAAAVPARPAAADGGRLRVLLVEDDADLRPVLKELLAAQGWEVVEVPDGKAAQAMLAADSSLDVVVTDVVMPGGVSGVDVARRAAQLRPGLPVVLISGYPTAILAAHGACEEEFDLLRKPFSGGELMDRIRLARRRRGMAHRSAEAASRNSMAD